MFLFYSFSFLFSECILLGPPLCTSVTETSLEFPCILLCLKRLSLDSILAISKECWYSLWKNPKCLNALYLLSKELEYPGWSFIIKCRLTVFCYQSGFPLCYYYLGLHRWEHAGCDRSIAASASSITLVIALSASSYICPVSSIGPPTFAAWDAAPALSNTPYSVALLYTLVKKSDVFLYFSGGRFLDGFDPPEGT